MATSLPRPSGPCAARQPTPGRGAGRDRAHLRHPPLDRAKLQTGQRRTGLGRLPGPLRPRHPPSPGPGQLRIHLLLGRLVRQSAPWRRKGSRTRNATSATTVLVPGITRDTRLAFPSIALQRWWQAWSNRPPPPALQTLMNSLAAGRGLHLYIRINKLPLACSASLICCQQDWRTEGVSSDPPVLRVQYARYRTVRLAADRCSRRSRKPRARVRVRPGGGARLTGSGVPCGSRQAEYFPVGYSPVKVIVHRLKQPQHEAAIPVTIETATDGAYFEEPAEIERYTLRFNHLVAPGTRP